MRSTSTLATILLLAGLLTRPGFCAEPATAALKAPAKTYRNPLLSEIEIADPFVLRVDGKFYLYNTDTMPGEPRGPLHKQIGVVVADSPLGPFTDKGVLAPEVAWVGLGL